MYGDFETFKTINSNCFVDYGYNVWDKYSLSNS